jgi:hypothetical protein
MITTSDAGYVLEKATIPIEERLAKIAGEKVRQFCCKDVAQCEGLCGVAVHEYRMLWAREWEKYARGN